MKIKLEYFSPLILLFIFTISSCSKSSSKSSTSRGTGWKIDRNNSFKEQGIAPGLVLIPGGTFTKGKVQDDIMRDWNNTPTQQQVQSFFIDETEVTNSMYLEYLNYLKKVYPPENTKLNGVYEAALPDTLVWRNRLSYNEDFVINYLRHPAFGEFPVVGVSWIQANQYAKWRTNRVNEAL